MQSVQKNKDLKISFIFTWIGLVASVMAVVYQMELFTEEIKLQIIEQLGSMQMLLVIGALQGGVFTFVASFLGLKMAKKVNLKLNFIYDKKSFVLALVFGWIIGLMITGADRFIFVRYLPDTMMDYAFSPIYLITGIFYGGFVEEILLRLFLMTLFVFILWRLFANSKASSNIPQWIYLMAIFLASAFFAAGHIPFTLLTIGDSTPILIRAFLLNGIGGIGFGYLYWKHGLAYAICAHASAHIFMQVVLMPILF